MWNIRNEIWEKQIGNQSQGRDFSGREIHYEDFQNNSSLYGWTLISFGDDRYLVAHVETEREFPRVATLSDTNEFVVNGKTFNVNRNKHGEWDINSVEYKEEYIPGKRKQTITDEITDYIDVGNGETNIFSFNNYNSNGQSENTDEMENEFVFEKTQELERKLKLESEKTHELEARLKLEKEKTKQLKNYTKKVAESKNKYSDDSRSFEITTDLFEINDGHTSIFNNSIDTSTMKFSSNKELLKNLTKKLDEQTAQINSLRQEQKYNQLKILEMENKKNEKATERKVENIIHKSQAVKLWEIEFGNKNYIKDFADRLMIKEKFGLDEEGGWTTDYYDSNTSIDMFIASTESIRDRDGRNNFIIDDINYFIDFVNGKWEINKSRKGQDFRYSSKNMKNIASSFRPSDTKKEKTYESFVSVLINLYHFPLIHLDKFETFIKRTLSVLPLFKDCFVYSNEAMYRSGRTNISSYARIFFRTTSIKTDMEILQIVLSFKKGMDDFIDNFIQTNRRDEVSYAIILLSHSRKLKFVHAETNFELLKAYPIPERTPLRHLIIDGEYNSILKYHENDLWKQIKPFAINSQANIAYYACDIDPDSIDV